MMARRAALVGMVALGCVVPRGAAAHGFEPGVLALNEARPGRFEIVWSPPRDAARAIETDVRPVFPEACRELEALLECGPEGLVDPVTFVGLPRTGARVVVVVRRLDGSVEQGVATESAPRFAPAARPGDSWLAWIRIGGEHVLGGLDHVAFVVGLLLVVGLGRRRDPRRADSRGAGSSRGVARRTLWAVTAFTVAHSITLALSVLDVVRLPAAPVEATIAASVVLVAREALHEQPTVTRRAPWAVAFAFGLVHGLGFAGAMRALALPEDALGTALVGFNVGVELGQLAIVALVAAVFLVGGDRLARARWPRAALGYAIGGAGTYWLIERAAAIVTA